MLKKFGLGCLYWLLILASQPIYAQTAADGIPKAMGIFALILILIGVGLIIAEAMVYSYGVLALFGLITFSIGLFILLENDLITEQLAWPILLAVLFISASIIFFTLYLALKSRRRKVVTGQEALIDRQATVVSEFIEHQGWVQFEGELWQAKAETNLAKGTKVKITHVNGLELRVRRDPHDTNLN